MDVLKRGYEKFCVYETAIGAIFLLTTVFVITVSALMRTIGYPINWAIDIALLLFSWSVFLGADAAWRSHKMVNVDFVLKKFPAKSHRFVHFMIHLIILVFLVTMVYLGLRLSITSRYRSFQGIPGLSYTWVTLSIPIPMLSMIITTLIKTYGLLIKEKNTEFNKEI